MNKDFYLYIYSILPTFSDIRKHQWDVFTNQKHYDTYAPEKKNGVLGVVAVREQGIINAMLPERPIEGGLLKEAFQCLHYYDYLLERTRTLFKIKLYNIPRTQGIEDVLSVSYAESFHTGVLEFIIRGPKPIVGDLSDIIDREEMTVKEYVDQGYYQRSMDRINQSSLMTEEEAQEITDHWYPQTTGKDLIEMVSNLYPVNPPQIQYDILKDNTRLWYYLYSFGLWYKENLALGKLYESIEAEDIHDLEIFLQGQDFPDSPIRDQVYTALDCVSEEDFILKLSRIKSLYQNVTENLTKKGKVVPVEPTDTFSYQ